MQSDLERQSGVVSRRQLAAAGLEDHDVRRLIRRRDLAPLLPGVFVGHTGPPTSVQRAWAAVLYAGPAALWGPTALAFARGSVTEALGPIHVAIDSVRRVRPQPDLVVHRVGRLPAQVLWNASPPRMRTEEAVLDVAIAASREVDAVAALTDAVQARLTTADRLSVTLQSRSRVARRHLIAGVLADVGDGTDSVLEHRYLTGVERAHALPRARRQAALEGMSYRHDVLHERQRVVIELDGRTHHTLARDRFADLERDTATLLADHVTVRLGWSQVVGAPCVTAAKVAALLRARGWEGHPRRCPKCPERGIFQSPGDWKIPR